MASNFLLRDITESTRKHLDKMAKRNMRSLNSEILTILNAEVEADKLILKSKRKEVGKAE